MKGKFVVIDGCDFTGKSTQIKKLSDCLHNKGVKHIITREPGGTYIGEEVRKIIMASGKNLTAKAELMLFLASRCEHVLAKIIPALDAGLWVVCDRFLPSTFVYQGVLRGVEKNLITQLHTAMFGDFTPDSTFIFDIEPAKILERMNNNALRDLNAYDSTAIDEISKIRNGFLEFAQIDNAHKNIHGNKCHIIYADQSVDTIHNLLLEKLGV